MMDEMTVSQGMSQTTPMRASVIGSALEELDKALEDLAQRPEYLSNELDAVLRPSVPRIMSEGKPETTDASATSPSVERIERAAARVRGITASLDGLRDRLDA